VPSSRSTWARPSVKVSRSSGEAECWASWYSASRRVVGHPGGEPPHGADPLEVEQRLLLPLHLLEGGAEHLAPFREEGHQPLDDAPLGDVVARLADGLEDVGRLPGLPQEAERVGPVDGRLERVHVGVPGQHDPGDVRAEAPELLEQVDAGHPRHALVGHDDVEGDLPRDLEGLVARRGHVDLPALLVLQDSAEHDEVVRLVVDEQNATGQLVAHAEPSDERGDLPFVDHGPLSSRDQKIPWSIGDPPPRDS